MTKFIFDVFLGRLWKYFKKLDPKAVGSNPDTRLPMNKLIQYKYLKCNPFADRIIAIFSSSEETNENGEFNFDDFVLMHSVFHADAPLSYKAHYAFQMFGNYIFLSNYYRLPHLMDFDKRHFKWMSLPSGFQIYHVKMEAIRIS